MGGNGDVGPVSEWCDGGVRAMMRGDDWEALVGLGSERRLAAGDVLMGQGEAGTRVHVLIEGRVRVARVEADGSEVLLAIRGPGEILGELSVLGGGAVSATVSALRPCLMRTMSASRFREFVRARELASPMLRHSAVRRRESEQARIEMGTLPVSRRLVRTLLRLVDALGVPVEGGIAVGPGVPQEDLARAIGASRSQVAAILGRLRAAGVLDTGRRRLVVRDPARLRALDAGRGDRPARPSGFGQ